MKKLVLKLENGEKRNAKELWNNNDELVGNILNEIETTEVLCFEQLKTVYNRFNELSEVDSKFELVSEENNEVVIGWPDENWVVTFCLE